MNVNGDRYEYWQAQHQARLKSGKSIADFCKHRDINASTYRQAVARYGFSEPGVSRPKPAFIELTAGETREKCVLEIEYRGFQVRLFPGVEPEVLRDTLEVLGEVR